MICFISSPASFRVKCKSRQPTRRRRRRINEGIPITQTTHAQFNSIVHTFLAFALLVMFTFARERIYWQFEIRSAVLVHCDVFTWPLFIRFPFSWWNFPRKRFFVSNKVFHWTRMAFAIYHLALTQRSVHFYFVRSIGRSVLFSFFTFFCYQKWCLVWAKKKKNIVFFFCESKTKYRIRSVFLRRISSACALAKCHFDEIFREMNNGKKIIYMRLNRINQLFHFAIHNIFVGKKRRFEWVCEFCFGESPVMI